MANALACTYGAPGGTALPPLSAVEYVGFVGVGHSNLRGQGDPALSNAWDPLVPNYEFVWNPAAPTAAAFESLRDPVGAWYGDGFDRGTLWPGFGRRFLACAGRGVVVTTVAHGGAKLDASAIDIVNEEPDNHFDPNVPAGHFFTGGPGNPPPSAVDASRRMFQAMLARSTGAQTASFGGWLVWLGGNDRQWLTCVDFPACTNSNGTAIPARLAEFRATWADFLDAYRDHVALYDADAGPTVRLMGGKVYLVVESESKSDRVPALVSVGMSQMRQALVEECEAHAHCGVATRLPETLRAPLYYDEDNPADDIHFDQDGLTPIGRSAGEGVAGFFAPL